MSSLTVEQVQNIIDRFGLTLDEWEDVEYIIAVRQEDGSWAFGERCSDPSKVVVAHTLLGRIVDVMIEEELEEELDEDEDEDEDDDDEHADVDHYGPRWEQD